MIWSLEQCTLHATKLKLLRLLTVLMLLYKDILSVIEPFFLRSSENGSERDGVQACCKKSQLELSCCCFLFIRGSLEQSERIDYFHVLDGGEYLIVFSKWIYRGVDRTTTFPFVRLSNDVAWISHWIQTLCTNIHIAASNATKLDAKYPQRHWKLFYCFCYYVCRVPYVRTFRVWYSLFRTRSWISISRVQQQFSEALAHGAFAMWYRFSSIYSYFLLFFPYFSLVFPSFCFAGNIWSFVSC